jgi:hypothetical protein
MRDGEGAPRFTEPMADVSHSENMTKIQLTTSWPPCTLAPMIRERVSSTIRRAEQDIRGLIAEAATSGDYDLVSNLSAIARRLSALAEEAAANASPTVDVPVAPLALVERKAVGKSAPPSARRTTRKDGYPRFEKARDTLVKVGWSKKERSEYIHKAPKPALDAVVQRIAELGRGGRTFTADNLPPVRISGGTDEVPSYQTYVCLAWLREVGVIEQHGREGYTVAAADLVAAVSTNWDTLPA